MTAATPSCQQGGCGIARSVASALKAGRGAGRPACCCRDRLDRHLKAGQRHDLAGQLAPAAGAAAGHVVDARPEAAAARASTTAAARWPA